MFSQNFKEDRILKGINLDLQKNQIVAYSPKTHVLVANLVGEDKDAWKFYLRKGKIKQALQSCKSSKQKAVVNGVHADSQFKAGKYKRAAEYYAVSNYSFEHVTMKFLKYKQMQGLQDYLLQVLDVYKRSKLNTDNRVQR